MNKSSSTSRRRKATTRDNSKPPKPYPDFPLSPHNNGQWCKRIKGTLYYFGLWSDHQAALDEYNRVRDDLYAGRKPRPKSDGVTVRELVNRFLTFKQDAFEAGDITSRTFEEYHATCAMLIKALGKERIVIDVRPDDFMPIRAKIAKRCGVYRVQNECQRIRSVFKFAYDNMIIDAPVRFGDALKPPTKRQKRLAKSKRQKTFSAGEIKALREHASEQLDAMILLGINCGLGNHDVATLPKSALDLKKGWLDFPRNKTGVARRCPLWKETIAALEKVIDQRSTPKNDADSDLVFLTCFGHRWSREWEIEKDGRNKSVKDDALSKEFSKLQNAAGVTRHRGRGFYGLRHSFRTVADGSLDVVAARHIMGHADDDSDMDANYTHGVTDDRLQAVVAHVRNWLFEPADDKADVDHRGLKIVG